MSQLSTGLGHQKKRAAIAVPPREASRMLSYSLSKVYELLRVGDLAVIGGRSLPPCRQSDGLLNGRLSRVVANKTAGVSSLAPGATFQTLSAPRLPASARFGLNPDPRAGQAIFVILAFLNVLRDFFRGSRRAVTSR